MMSPTLPSAKQWITTATPILNHQAKIMTTSSTTRREAFPTAGLALLAASDQAQGYIRPPGVTSTNAARGSVALKDGNQTAGIKDLPPASHARVVFTLTTPESAKLSPVLSRMELTAKPE